MAPLSEASRTWLLRGKLYARDGLEGDRRAAEKAASEVFTPPGEASSVVSRLLLHETRSGGRYAARQVAIGDRIGACVVTAAAGRRGAHKLFEVTCAGCSGVQIRTASQINTAWRRAAGPTCPRCMQESVHGRIAERAAARLERVRAGGPVWTGGEILWLMEEVRADLEAAFGMAEEEPWPTDLASLAPATGYPYSAEDGLVASERREVERRDEEAASKRARKEAKALGELADAVASGDKERIEAAMAATERAARSKKAAEPDRAIYVEPRAPLPADLLAAHPQVARCDFCGQRMVWVPSEPKYCSRRCEVRHEKFLVDMREKDNARRALEAESRAEQRAAEALKIAREAAQRASARLVEKRRREGRLWFVDGASGGKYIAAVVLALPGESARHIVWDLARTEGWLDVSLGQATEIAPHLESTVTPPYRDRWLTREEVEALALALRKVAAERRVQSGPEHE